MNLGDLIVYEQKRRDRTAFGQNSRFRGKWWLFSAAFLLVLVASLIPTLEGWFIVQPSFALPFLLGFLYACPSIGAFALSAERKEETWFWWLSLPAPRQNLMAAKWLNAVFRWSKFWLLLLAYMVLYTLALDLTLGQWSWNLLANQLIVGGEVALLGFLYEPPLVTLGLGMGSMSGKYKLLLIPMWAFIVFLINTPLTISIQTLIAASNIPGVVKDIGPEFIRRAPWLPIALVAAYVLAGAIFFGLVRWLKRQR